LCLVIAAMRQPPLAGDLRQNGRERESGSHQGWTPR
jgi:hypothetical protein